MKKEKKEIIPPLDKTILIEEIKKSAIQIIVYNDVYSGYSFNAIDSVLLMQEVGRMRELYYRSEGAGTGKKADIDEHDEFFNNYFIFDKISKEIVGGFRLAHMNDLINPTTFQKIFSLFLKKIYSPTEELFELTADFRKDILPSTAEIGRIFVHPKLRKNKTIHIVIMSMLEIWRTKNTNIHYLFGKISIFPKTEKEGEMDAVYFFLKRYFTPPKDKIFLVFPKQRVYLKRPSKDKGDAGYSAIKNLFSCNSDYNEDVKIVRDLGAPMILISCADAFKKIYYWGAAKHEYFNSEEVCLLIDIRV